MVTEPITKIELLKDFLEKNYLSEIYAGKDYLEVDVSKIMVFNPELVDDILDDYEEIIKCFEIAIDDLLQKNKRKVQIIYTNIPESTTLPLSEISDQTKKLHTFEGVVLKPTDIFLKCKSARFICPSCDSPITIYMPNDNYKTPSACSCGRKGGFIESSKNLVKFQRLELVEVLKEIPDKPRILIRRKVYLEGALVRKEVHSQIQPGQRVKIYGYLDTEELPSKQQKGKTNEYSTFIVANNIVPINTSWEAIKFTDEAILTIQEMSKNKELLAQFSQSFAPSFEGYELLRKSLILQHVGGKRIMDKNKNIEERGVIHILLSGSPGTGKSYLLKKSATISPLWTWTTGGGLTKVGLIACVVKDEYGRYTLEAGAYVMSDGGCCLIDEMEKMDPSDFSMLNNAMNDEQTKITKANIDQTLRTRTSLLGSSNPIHKIFTTNDSIMSQLKPIPRDILDRFDVIWPMRESINNVQLESKYLSRHISVDENKPIWSIEEMRLYIAYCRRINPILSLEMASYFGARFALLTGKTKPVGENEDGLSQSNRLRGNILRFIYAHSKFYGPGKHNENMEVDITKEDIDFTFLMMKHSFQLLGLVDESGFVKYEVVEDVPKKEEINCYYAIKEIIREQCSSNNNVALYDSVLEEARKRGINEDEFEKVISKLRANGDIYEPKIGRIRIL